MAKHSDRLEYARTTATNARLHGEFDALIRCPGRRTLVVPRPARLCDPHGRGPRNRAQGENPGTRLLRRGALRRPLQPTASACGCNRPRGAQHRTLQGGGASPTSGRWTFRCRRWIRIRSTCSLRPTFSSTLAEFPASPSKIDAPPAAARRKTDHLRPRLPSPLVPARRGEPALAPLHAREPPRGITRR